jgi:hypothetical protein
MDSSPNNTQQVNCPFLGASKFSTPKELCAPCRRLALPFTSHILSASKYLTFEMNRATDLTFFAALPALLCSCHTPPPVTAISRPEVKIVDYADIQRRRLVPPKTQFYRTDTVAICVHGFAGRTVTIQISEQRRGLVKTWTQYIAAPYERRSAAPMVYHENLGAVRSTAGQPVTQVEQDYVVPWAQPPPGTYEVRVISKEGIVQQASFSVSN